MPTKNILSASSKWLIVACISLVFFSSCRIVTNKLAETYSGQTLFDGIFMSNGDILGFDTEIQNDVQAYLKTDKQKQAFLKFEKELVSQLAKDNPDFVREFYNKMYSKDKEKVKEALEDAGKLVEKELQALTGDDEITAEKVVGYALKKYDVAEQE